MEHPMLLEKIKVEKLDEDACFEYVDVASCIEDGIKKEKPDGKIEECNDSVIDEDGELVENCGEGNKLEGMAYAKSETNTLPNNVVDGTSNTHESIMNVESVVTSNDKTIILPRNANTRPGVSSCIRKPIRIDKILKYVELNQQAKQSVTDDLDLFFASVCKSSRKLTRKLQNKIKKGVLEIIIRAEEEFEKKERFSKTLPTCASPNTLSPLDSTSISRSVHDITEKEPVKTVVSNGFYS